MVVKDDLNLGDEAKEVHYDLANVAKVVHDDLANVAKVVHDDLADVAKIVPDIVVAECGRQGTESGHRHPENCSSGCACGGRYGNTLFWRWTLKFDHSLLGSPRILELFEDDGSDAGVRVVR